MKLSEKEYQTLDKQDGCIEVICGVALVVIVFVAVGGWLFGGGV